MESNIISKSYECDIKILSPVHIGSGESYSLRECVLAKTRKGERLLKRMDLSAYYASLPNDRDKERFLDELMDENFRLSKFHKILLEQEKKNNELTPDKEPKNEYVSVNEFERYKCVDKRIKGQLDIFENVKTLDKVYIPGSSLKGAIRTALLYHSIDEGIISDFITWNRKRRQEELQSYKLESFINKFFSEDERNAAKSDDLKYLHVSDSNTFNLPTVYQANQIRVAYDMENNEKGIEDGTKSFIETISFEDFKTESLKSEINIKYNEDVIDKSKEKYLDIEYIKESIFEFSEDLIEFELEFADRFNLDYLIDFYNKLDNDPDEPLLRIGAGSGLMGTSIALRIKNYDEDVFRILFKKTDGTIFPRTRRLAVSQVKPEVEGVPLGWVKLNFKEIEKLENDF